MHISFVRGRFQIIENNRDLKKLGLPKKVCQGIFTVTVLMKATNSTSNGGRALLPDFADRIKNCPCQCYGLWHSFEERSC